MIVQHVVRQDLVFSCVGDFVEKVAARLRISDYPFKDIIDGSQFSPRYSSTTCSEVQPVHSYSLCIAFIHMILNHGIAYQAAWLLQLASSKPSTN